MKETITCQNCGYVTEHYKNPLPTADVIVAVEGGVVLIKRKNPPYGWALPGGFIDYGESAEHAAKREIKEETGLEITDLKQFRCYSAPERDPRFHTITVVFTANSAGVPHAGDDAVEAGIFNCGNLPKPLAFDHEHILRDYFDSLTNNSENKQIPE